MDKASSTSRFKRVVPLQPIFAAALLAVAIDAALHLLPEGFMTRTLHLRAQEIVQRQAPRIQIMGDSVSAALRPPVIASQIGCPPEEIANYSLPGTSPLFAYFTLRREIEAGRIPKAIVFAPHPGHFSTPMFERLLGRFATTREAWDYARAGAKLDDMLFGGVCRLSYTMRYREELYGVVLQGDREFFHTLKTPAVSLAITEAGLPKPEEPAEGSGPTFREGELPGPLLAGFSVDPLCGKFVERFLDLAEAHQIQVLWVSMPGIGVLHQRWERNGDLPRFQAYLEGLAQRHRNLTLLHPSVDPWPDRYFSDPRHFNHAGAWRLSEQLGQELAAHLRTHPLQP